MKNLKFILLVLIFLIGCSSKETEQMIKNKDDSIAVLKTSFAEMQIKFEELTKENDKLKKDIEEFIRANEMPSDEVIRNQIEEYIKKCKWKITDPKEKIYETYTGQKTKIKDIKILAKSFENKIGTVKFNIKGLKIGKYDTGEAWYGMTYESALPYLSDTFSYEGEWKFLRYDTGWKISEEPQTYKAFFTYK